MLKKLKNFYLNTSGNFAMTLGLCLLPFMMSVGLAVDYSRMGRLQTRVQAAADAALLVATKEMQKERAGKTNEQLVDLLEDKFEPFFAANMGERYGDYESYEIDFVEVDNEAKAVVTVNYEPAIMQIFGHNEIPIATNLTVNLKVIPEKYVIDIVFCIDATGSMQDTLDGVKASASSFNEDLLDELGASTSNNSIKTRIRPIFYRDWEDVSRYGGSTGLDGGTAGYNPNGAYWSNHKAFKAYPNFIDLNPKEGEGNAADNTAVLQTFLGSESAAGGGDWPEGAMVCVNRATKDSNWWVADSQASRDFFNIADATTINDGTPNSTNVNVIPIVVFWSDATISHPSYTRYYMDGTQPGSWSGMENVWNNASHMPQDNKLLVHFGPKPNGYTKGWKYVKNWDGYTYGGSLDIGNENAARVIGEKILEAVPDVLRLGS